VDPSYLIILLLSLIPFIEARGAMFVGFSMGITSPWVYAACFLLNTAQALLYPQIFRRTRISEGGFSKKIIQRAKKAFPYGYQSAFFLIGIPAPGNGINVFSSSLLSHVLDLKNSVRWIVLGAALRDVLTFVLLSGAYFTASAFSLQSLLQVLFLGFLGLILYHNRQEYLDFFGLKIRKGYSLRWAAIGAGSLALIAIILLSQDAALVAKHAFSIVMYGKSDGKMLLLFGLFALLPLIRSKVEQKPASTETDHRIYFLFFVLIAILALGSILIASWLILGAGAKSEAAGIAEIPLQNATARFFLLDGRFYTGYIDSPVRLSHNHVLKPAAFLPLSYLDGWPGISRFDIGLPIAPWVPSAALLLLFVTFCMLALAAIGAFCRLGALRGLLFILIFFAAAGAVVDAGPLSEIFKSSFVALAILLPFGKNDGRLKMVLAFVAIAILASDLLSLYMQGAIEQEGYLQSAFLLSIALAAARPSPEKLLYLAALLIVLFHFASFGELVPADNFQEAIHGKDVLVFLDDKQASAYKFAIEPKLRQIGGLTTAAFFTNFSGEKITDAFSGPAPKELQAEYMCVANYSEVPPTLAIVQSSCNSLGLEKPVLLNYSEYDTRATLTPMQNDGSCLVLIEISGKFASCRLLALSYLHANWGNRSVKGVLLSPAYR
jgi:hypothetical protein